MKRNVTLWLVAAGLGLALQSSAQTGPAGPSPNPNAAGTGTDAFVSDVSQRTFTVTGAVVRRSQGRLVVRIEDGRHQIPFDLASAVGADVRVGSQVSVTYHPNGATGQTAADVQVLEAPRRARR
jgi:hypothetical protein